MAFLSNRIHIYYNVCVFEDSLVSEDVGYLSCKDISLALILCVP